MIARIGVAFHCTKGRPLGDRKATMPCLLVIFALFLPRVVIVLLFLFSDYLARAYESVLWPLLGFFFMPLTTLAYAWTINSHGRVDGLYLFIIIVAALMDVTSLGGGEGYRRRRGR